MNAYAEYIRMHPEEVELVAVVDPNEARRQHYATSFKLLPARCFASWEDFLSGPKVADAVFLCTPDHLALPAGNDGSGKRISYFVGKTDCPKLAAMFGYRSEGPGK